MAFTIVRGRSEVNYNDVCDASDSCAPEADNLRETSLETTRTTTDGSICSVVEPIFFSKVFWSTLGEARWVEILRKTCKTFARAGDHSNRDSMGSTATHAVDKWEDFALDSVLDFASHLAYVRSIHALFLPTSTGKALLDEESCNARKIAMAG
jgi:hypothetical protein